MSLLKALQRRLCCVQVPWLPPADGATARFLNEIVLAEESDADGQGGYASHFELYRRAMIQSGASTNAIDCLIDTLRSGIALNSALESPNLPPSVRAFVRHTFDVVESEDLPTIAAAFLFGREDLLPDVFQRIVNELNNSNHGMLQEFNYYLQRHIELDGGEHAPLASRLLRSLCEQDGAKWQHAEVAAVESLQARKVLWDGIFHQIVVGRPVPF